MYTIIMTAAVIVLLYLFAIMPRIYYKPDYEPFQVRYFAHRGLHKSRKKSPENSMKAFELAVESEYGIELDVQLTKDGVPVVFHDYSLLRVCGVDKLLTELPYAEIEKLRLFQSDEGIPKFLDVLNMVDGRVPMIVEIKAEWHVKETCRAADTLLRAYKGPYCVQSFSPLAVLWFRKNHGNIMRGQLASDFNQDRDYGNRFLYFVLKNLLLNFLSRPDFIAYNYKYRENLSFRLCTKLFGAEAFGWTIRSQETLDDNRKYFEYFIFDHFIPR